MSKISIVVVAFNRPESLRRNLNSLNKSEYPNKVKLIISIDKGENRKVLEVAKDFSWSNGEKEIIYHEKNLGLKEHILFCGNLTKKHGNILLLEDDIIVSSDFYNFALQSLDFYNNNNNVAGVSLYSPHFNGTASLPFQPYLDTYDAYFSQMPSSWGQLWTSSQWEAFSEWYISYEYRGKLKEDRDLSTKMPDNIMNWPESSWKKYYAAYMIKKNKYFVYPYTSYSTNFGDIGTHYWRKNNVVQVPLSYSKDKQYTFCELNETKSVYDIFYENLTLSEEFVSKPTVDLYGQKKQKSYNKYLITTRKLNYKVEDSFDLTMKPIEDNVFNNVKGTGIYLYNTNKKVINNFPESTSLLEYYYGHIKPLKLMRLLMNVKTLQLVVKKILISLKK